MPSPVDPGDEPPLRPPETDHGLGRWLLAAVLVLVIVGGAWRAYQWLVSDVERRRAVVTEQVAPAAVPAAPVAPAPPATAPPAAGRTVAPPQAGAPAEAPAPAVIGQAIHRCRIDGQVTYTNQPCAEGTEDLPTPALGADPNGVVGLAGDSVPAALPAGISLEGASHSQRDAVCAYLAAEIARLDFEFQQALPPPVLDHLSTRLGSLRAQHRAAECVAAGAPGGARPTSPRQRAPTPVGDEKRAH